MKALIAIAALVACSAASASDVTYKCVVEHRIGADISKMQPSRFKIDHEYRIETVASYLDKTDGGYPGIDMEEGNKYTYAVRPTNKDPSNGETWAVLRDFGLTFDLDMDTHDRLTYGVFYSFNAGNGRLVVANVGEAGGWTLGEGDYFDTYTDFATCTAHYD